MADRDPADLGAGRGARTTKRRGRMSATKVASLAALAPTWTFVPLLPVTADALAAAFDRDGTRLLDIGVGNGEASLAHADAHPDHDLLAVELHRPGIVNLLRRLDARAAASEPTNVRILEADVTVLVEATEPGAFAAVRVLFPDPWPKRRHWHRRLVDAAFVHTIADLLPPGGTLHLATDWPDYADQMRAALALEPRFIPQVDVEGEAADGPADPGGDTAGPRWRSHRPDRPLTAYEQRGVDAGRAIIDLIVVRD